MSKLTSKEDERQEERAIRATKAVNSEPCYIQSGGYYNGYKNHATYNVALHIKNDSVVHMAAVWADDYIQFCELMRHDFGYTETPDQVAYNDTSLDVRKLSELIEDTKADNEA